MNAEFLAVSTPAQLKSVLKKTLRNSVIAVVDIGFGKRKSCGLAVSPPIENKYPKPLGFSDALKEVAEIFKNYEEVILLIEAPLSRKYSNKNPSFRDGTRVGLTTKKVWSEEHKKRNSPKDKSMGWYHGAGISTHFAAGVFLDQLELPRKIIHVVEVFSSDKPEKKLRVCDACEASYILKKFEGLEKNLENGKLIKLMGAEEMAPISGVPLVFEVNVPAKNESSWIRNEKPCTCRNKNRRKSAKN